MFVSDGCAEEAVLVYLHGLQGLHSLRALVPGLLRCEIEQAMVKLGLIYDKSYAWDIFSDMMVSRCNPMPSLHSSSFEATLYCSRLKMRSLVIIFQAVGFPLFLIER